MDLFLICLSGFLILLGIAGSFLPVIPGPLTAWAGLFVLSCVSSITYSLQFLIISFSVALFIFLLDILIPILGAKKFGGGKGSTYGASIGLVIGILFLGPFFGAFFGELIANQKNKKGALKAAFGALIGFLSGVFLKFIVGLSFGYYFLQALWTARTALL
jgi:uncharacterized protein YqgC (DUF456 family)